MAMVTSAVTPKSATVKLLELRAFYPKWSDDAFDTLGNGNFFLYKQDAIRFDAVMI